MRETVIDFLVKRLSEWGVGQIYGYPGDDINLPCGLRLEITGSGSRRPTGNYRTWESGVCRIVVRCQ